MDKIDNAIESAYRALAENLSKDNILLYSEVPDPKLQIVFSTLHKSSLLFYTHRVNLSRTFTTKSPPLTQRHTEQEI